jgi:hypothetical protein
VVLSKINFHCRSVHLRKVNASRIKKGIIYMTYLFTQIRMKSMRKINIEFPGMAAWSRFIAAVSGDCTLSVVSSNPGCYKVVGKYLDSTTPVRQTPFSSKDVSSKDVSSKDVSSKDVLSKDVLSKSENQLFVK